MATKLVTDSSIELFRACAIVEVGVARYKCTVR
jgi:hypothetical protein